MRTSVVEEGQIELEQETCGLALCSFNDPSRGSGGELVEQSLSTLEQHEQSFLRTELMTRS